jgi:serine beta-lactamase-like protein LACTB, mitochondrial
LALFCALKLPAQQKKLDEQRRIQMESSVARFMASGSVPGVSVAVVGGEYVWSEGFGMADLENFVPRHAPNPLPAGIDFEIIDRNTAMQLWERGKLDLDAPVQKYCPAFPQKRWPITSRQLLGHLGEIRHYKSDSQDDPEGGNTRHFDDPIEAGLNFSPMTH